MRVSESSLDVGKRSSCSLGKDSEDASSGRCWHGHAMTDSLDHEIFVTYCLTAQLDDGLIRAAVEQLSEEERRRHDRLSFSRDRRDFAVAHTLLRRALSAHGDRAPHEWTFTSNAYGKPALAPGMGASTQLSFNLAHTDGLVASVVTRNAALGIDVEAVDRRIDALALASRFFSPIRPAVRNDRAAPSLKQRLKLVMLCRSIGAATQIGSLWSLFPDWVVRVLSVCTPSDLSYCPPVIMGTRSKGIGGPPYERNRSWNPFHACCPPRVLVQSSRNCRMSSLPRV